jgi:GDP-L-fucose synthase
MNFWSNRRVLVTGGAGFLGRQIVGLLGARGAEVLAPRKSDCDLTRAEAVHTVFREGRPDCVIHAAADVGGIGYNGIAPADIFQNNLRMAVNLLEAARHHPVEKLVLVGSACAYPGTVAGRMREEEFEAGPMHPSVEVYGFSKRALYTGAKAFRRQYGLQSIFLLLTNLYGPGDKFDPRESHVVAALIRKFVEARRQGAGEVVCWGSGRPTREFMYVEDCARAILRAAEIYADPEPLNIGTGEGTTIRELAETVWEVSRYAGRIVWDTSMPDGAMYKVLDVSRMRAILGLEPTVSLREGLRRTVAWYEANGGGAPAPDAAGWAGEGEGIVCGIGPSRPLIGAAR